MRRETIPLLHNNSRNSALNLFFATLCIVDIFGVFPIVALPRAIVQCGLLGIPLVLVVFGLQIYTATLLGKSWNIVSSLDPQVSRKNRYPFAAVTELTLGPRIRKVVTVLLNLTIFSGGIPNLLVASQNLHLFGLKTTEGELDVSFCYWLLIVGVFLCPLVWFGSPRDMKGVAVVSCMAVALTAILVWSCIINDDRKLTVSPVPTSPSWEKFISGYGMLAFQFDVHPSLMTIQVDMKRPKDITKAVILGFAVGGLFFGVTAALVVWKYGGSTTTNVLNVVPPEGFAIKAAILLSALQLCLSSVVGHAALFLQLEDGLRVQRAFGWRRCALRSAVIFLGVAVGESVPRFDVVMALIGGTLTGPLVFVLPPLIYAKAISLKSTESTPSITARRLNYTDDNDSLMTSDTRIHSRSVYFGFPADRERREAFVYYEGIADDDNEGALFEGTEHDDEQLPLGVILDPSEVLAIPGTGVERRRNRTKGFRRTFDYWFGCFVVILGILITVSSTYINVKNTVRFVRFTPPCIVNSSVSG